MIIREVEVKDAKALLVHSNLVAQETDFLAREVGELDISIEDEEKLIRRWKASPNTNFLICEIDSEIVASCIISGRQGRKRLAHVVTLGISVNKEHWGKGIATELMKAQFEFCHNNKIRKINLEVMVNNHKAKALYEKLGFEVEGIERMAICVDGEYIDNYYMGLIL